jgi:serine/threonine protein kinase/Tol biopolymer transport system component
MAEAAPAVRGINRIMTLAHGSQFGSYQISALIGVGGMGEVYRARDPELEREVALKILPQAGRPDAEAIQRFEREARLLASLNHPNVATLHGLEHDGDAQALVMEFVDGPTVEELIARSPGGRGIALPDALDIAEQIARALDAAHEKGIVHRDLKPANIKVRADGTVKVLDFGIAKALATDARPGDGQQLTQVQGGPIGTPSYMSPEQASGGEVDRRTDIWAFGCVLFEMLCGQRVFDGDTNSRIIARVIERDPDWSGLPAGLPRGVRSLLEQCLEKDPRRRRRDARDLLLELERARLEPSEERRSTRGRSRAWAFWLAGGTSVLAVALAIALVFKPPQAKPPWHMQIATPATFSPQHFALSPDGRFIVFAALDPSDGIHRLYLRDLEADPRTAAPIRGTDGARFPFWSPDSSAVGFFAARTLYRIDVLTGGQPQPLAPAFAPRGGTWNKDGTILFTPDTVTPLLQVAAAGGDTSGVVPQLAGQANQRFPDFLPDNRRFLFYAAGESDVSGIYLGSLDGGEPRRLVAADSAAFFVEPDRVVYVQDGALVARRLDLDRGQLTGEQQILASAIEPDEGRFFGFSASSTGMLAYRVGGASETRGTWLNGAGEVTAVEDSLMLNGPAFSPDGRYLAYDNTVGSNRDVWIRDLERGGERRITTHPMTDGYPIWSRDGETLIFESNRDGTFDLWNGEIDRPGQETHLYGGEDFQEIPLDWSDDDAFVLFSRSDIDYSASDLMALPMSGEDRTPIVIADEMYEERHGSFSPAARWVAYDTNRSGRSEIVVQAFPEPDRKYFLSQNGGESPLWSDDGTEIYFIAPDRTIMVAGVQITESGFEFETPKPWLVTHVRSNPFNQPYAVMADRETGEKRIVIDDILVDENPAPITLILNWQFGN